MNSGGGQEYLSCPEEVEEIAEVGGVSVKEELSLFVWFWGCEGSAEHDLQHGWSLT